MHLREWPASDPPTHLQHGCVRGASRLPLGIAAEKQREGGRTCEGVDSVAILVQPVQILDGLRHKVRRHTREVPVQGRAWVMLRAALLMSCKRFRSCIHGGNQT